MNDRFSSRLRQHLLETADDRLDYDHLDSVIERVAITGQRHPLLVRLTWGLERFGPVPAAAVRYGLAVAALALAAGAGAALGGAAAMPQPSTVFEGTWITVDPGDGSGMTLVVGPGTTPEVYFEDGYATGYACVDDVVKRFMARGTGQVTADRLEASFPDGGGCGLIGRVEMSGVYHHFPRQEGSGDDTLTDGDGVVWTRALGGQQETQAPETAAPETPAPETAAPETAAPATAEPATPLAETPAPETPAAETLPPETPATETPAASESPAAETPSPEAPAAETPFASSLPEETPDTPMATIPPG